MSTYVTGFMDVAKKYGIPEKQAMFSLKAAAAADPAIAAQAGMDPSGGQGMPPQDLGAGQPPLPQEGGIPPELEQLINSLPPEVLQQLLAEVQQELQGGGQGEGQGGPSEEEMAMMQQQQGQPQGMQQKQGSYNEELLLGKTAEYQEGFLSMARDLNVGRELTSALYKKALAEMEANPIDLNLFPDTQEKRAAHAEGVILRAMEIGFSEKEAVDLYKTTFVD